MIPDNKGTCLFFERACVDKECKECDKYDTSSKPNTNINMDSRHIDKTPKDLKVLEALAYNYEASEEYKKKSRKAWIIAGVLFFLLLVALPIFFVYMFTLLETF